MSSKIDASGINPQYPVASINQSSQGFRDNFKSIKQALVQAKTESTILLGTTFTVSGQGIASYTTSPIEAYGGNIPLTISLANQGDLTAGTYDTANQNLKIEVNSSGVISSINIDEPLPPLDTSSIISITKNPSDPNFQGQEGIASLTLPTIKTNGTGQIVSSGTETISNFGIVGYQMQQGQILVGSNNNRSTFQNIGQQGQVLTVDPNSPTGLSWKSIEVSKDNSISAGAGFTITNNELEYNIQALPSNNSFDGLTFLTKGSTHSNTSWNAINNQVLTNVANVGYIKSVYDDKAPILAGDLATNGKNIKTNASQGLAITSGSAGLALSSTGTTNVNGLSLNLTSPSLTLNGIQIPSNPPSSNNSVMVVGQNGSTQWLSQSSLMPNISGDSTINVSTSGNSNQLSFQPWNIKAGALSNSGMILTVDKANKGTMLVPASALTGSITVPGITFVSSSQGDDIAGSGSITYPMATIEAAIKKYPTQMVVLLPGTYSPSSQISYASITSYIAGQSVINNGNFSNCTLTNVSISSGSFTTSTATNCVVTGSLTVSGTCSIVDSVFSATTSNTGTLLVDGCYNSNNFYATITTSGTLTVIDSSYISVTHNSGSCNIDGVKFLGNIISSADTTSGNILVVRNSSLSTNTKEVIAASDDDNATDVIEWYTIQKSGQCPYILQNVARMPSRDNLVGFRLEYASIDEDIGITSKASNITANNFMIDNTVRFYDLTIQTNNVTFSWANTTDIDTSKYAKDMYILLRGTSTSTNGTITWPSGIFPGGMVPAWQSQDGGLTLYHFVYTVSGWVCVSVSPSSNPLTVNSVPTDGTNSKITQLAIQNSSGQVWVHDDANNSTVFLASQGDISNLQGQINDLITSLKNEVDTLTAIIQKMKAN